MGVKKIGRPKSNPTERKMSKGLRVEQWKRIKFEAKARSIPAAMLLRNIVDWYLESLDISRKAQSQSELEKEKE